MAMPGPRHVSASVYHRDLDQNLPRPLSDIPEATQSQEASQVSLLSHISHLSSRISQALSHLPPPSEHTTEGEEPDYQSGLDSSQYEDAAEAESGWLGWLFCCWSEMDWRWSNSVSSDTIDGGVGWGRRQVYSALPGHSQTRSVRTATMDSPPVPFADFEFNFDPVLHHLFPSPPLMMEPS
jgi:hypothetical protein